MLGIRFTKYTPPPPGGKRFEDLLRIFLQLLTISSGNVSQSLEIMNELDRRYKLTDSSYGIGDFIDDLKKKGYLDEPLPGGEIKITSKTEQSIRKQSLEEIFGKIKKSGRGNHVTPNTGQGDELTSDRREYRFGDSFEQIDLTDSIRNAQINHGVEQFNLSEDDLTVQEKDWKALTSTVLMIDISHSMILYGEDRITPAKMLQWLLQNSSELNTLKIHLI